MTDFVSCAAEISKVRATDPERIATLLRKRKRRPLHTGDGRLMIVACDHPGPRGVDGGQPGRGNE